MPGYDSHKITVSDGLSLEARRFEPETPTQRAPCLCLPGLTRNASDFDELAAKIVGTGRPVVALSLRGRGRSDTDPDPGRYFPTTYATDAIQVLDAFEIEKAVFIGTSLGGIITMLVNETAPQRVAAAIINDVGPDLAPEGIDRISGYVGRTDAPAASLEEAAGRIRAINAVAFPDASEEDWITFAKRTFRKTEKGWVLDYDPAIATALAENGPAPDLWPGWTSLRDTPTLLVHGEISDLLTPPIIDAMREAHPDFRYAPVPRVGHAPFMTEPDAWAAIEAFLAEIP